MCTSSIGSSPTRTTSALECSTRSDSPTPVAACHPPRLVALDVDGNIHALEQIGQTLDRVTHHVAADMVGVSVAHEHARKAHAVLGKQVEESPDVVRRVDDDGFARLPVTDQVAEVHHLTGERVLASKVASREKLAEVEPFVQVLGGGHGPNETIGKEIHARRYL